MMLHANINTTTLFNSASSPQIFSKRLKSSACANAYVFCTDGHHILCYLDKASLNELPQGNIFPCNIIIRKYSGDAKVSPCMYTSLFNITICCLMSKIAELVVLINQKTRIGPLALTVCRYRTTLITFFY